MVTFTNAMNRTLDRSMQHALLVRHARSYAAFVSLAAMPEAERRDRFEDLECAEADALETADEFSRYMFENHHGMDEATRLTDLRMVERMVLEKALAQTVDLFFGDRQEV